MAPKRTRLEEQTAKANERPKKCQKSHRRKEEDKTKQIASVLLLTEKQKKEFFSNVNHIHSKYLAIL